MHAEKLIDKSRAQSNEAERGKAVKINDDDMVDNQCSFIYRNYHYHKLYINQYF